MARPSKQGIDYFPYDTDLDQDDKLGMIIGEYGDKGERLFTKVLCWIYKHEGYYSNWDEDVQLRFLRRYNYCGFSKSFLEEVVPRFVKWGLFNRAVFDTFHILTSHRVQKTWLEASRKRKQRFVLKNIWLLSITDGITAEEIQKKAEETDKGKESKLKESKVNPNRVVPPDAVPPKKSGKKKKKEIPEPHWEKLVEAWFDFNKKNYKSKPSFKERDPVFLKKIIQELKKRAEEKNLEWTEENAVLRFQKFLEYAYKDGWLKEHFLLENLNKQFDVIIQPKQKQESPPQKFTIPAKVLSKTERDINFHYGLFMAGKLNVVNLSAEDFEFMITKGLKLDEVQNISVQESVRDYMTTEKIPNDVKTVQSLAKRFAVIEHFKTLKQNGYATVFGLE